MAAPSITWVKYNSAAEEVSLTTSNTVDYDAVEAGYYSNILCVRPKFNGTASAIGRIRFYWYGINATCNGENDINLPADGWVMKYYVTDCLTMTGDTEKSGTQSDNLKTTIQSFNETGIKQSMTTYGPVLSTELKGKYCKSVWQQPIDTKCLSMQPIPFFTPFEKGVLKQEETFKTNYKSYYPGLMFNSSTSTESVSTLTYSVGGVLNTELGCNYASSVSVNSQFPYIFLSVCPPTDATAGTWSGFSCRLSFIWPYS